MLFDGESDIAENLSHERMYSWYFTREELEKLSSSRKDGITQSKESEIRHLYCSFIRDVGMRLKLYVISFAAKTFSVCTFSCTCFQLSTTLQGGCNMIDHIIWYQLVNLNSHSFYSIALVDQYFGLSWILLLADNKLF
jgi:hypothetical protein